MGNFVFFSVVMHIFRMQEEAAAPGESPPWQARKCKHHIAGPELSLQEGAANHRAASGESTVL